MTTQRRRYTPQERERILAAAASQGLSGPKAAKKFGISTLTFYTWRKKAGFQPTPAGSTLQAAGSLAGIVRAQVQAKVRAILPGIVREETSAFVQQALGGRRRVRT